MICIMNNLMWNSAKSKVGKVDLHKNLSCPETQVHTRGYSVEFLCYIIRYALILTVS